jgi:hypothetical protein
MAVGGARIAASNPRPIDSYRARTHGRHRVITIVSHIVHVILAFTLARASRHPYRRPHRRLATH